MSDIDNEEAAKGCATIVIVMLIGSLLVAVWWLGYHAGHSDGYIKGVTEFKELQLKAMHKVYKEEADGQ